MPRRKTDEKPDITTPHGRLRWARVHAGYGTAVSAAAAMGVPTGTYLGHENGSRAMDADVATRYARFFQVRWVWILRGEGAPGPLRDWVPVVGYVGGGDEVFPIDDHAMGASQDRVERPPGVGPQAVAVRVRGHSMHPAYRDGDLIVYDDEPQAAPRFLGKECVVRLSDGRMYIKVLSPGTKIDRFTLVSYNAPPIIDAEVEWASPVRWVSRG